MPASLDVVVEPSPQPRPGPGQRLVRDLDHTVVAGDQPGRDQQVDEIVLAGVGDHLAARHPACARAHRRRRERPAAA